MSRRIVRVRKNEKAYWLSCADDGICLWDTCPTPHTASPTSKSPMFFYGQSEKLAYWSKDVFNKLYPSQRFTQKKARRLRRAVIRNRTLMSARVR